MKKTIVLALITMGINSQAHAGLYTQTFQEGEMYRDALKRNLPSPLKAANYETPYFPEELVEGTTILKDLKISRTKEKIIRSTFLNVNPEEYQLLQWFHEKIKSKEEENKSWKEEVLRAINEKKIYDKATYLEYRQEKKKSIKDENPQGTLEKLAGLQKFFSSHKLEETYGLEVRKTYEARNQVASVLYNKVRIHLDKAINDLNVKCESKQEVVTYNTVALNHDIFHKAGVFAVKKTESNLIKDMLGEDVDLLKVIRRMQGRAIWDLNNSNETRISYEKEEENEME